MKIKQLKLDGVSFYPKVAVEGIVDSNGDNAIDDVVTEGSEKLITSGAVYDVLQTIPGGGSGADTAVRNFVGYPIDSSKIGEDAIYGFATQYYKDTHDGDASGMTTAFATLPNAFKGVMSITDKVEDAVDSMDSVVPWMNKTKINGRVITIGDNSITVPSEGGGSGITEEDLQSALYDVDRTLRNDLQSKLVSGTNIKTVNGTSLLGSGNITISSGGTIAVDSTLSSTSTNPLQNKAIYSSIQTINGNISSNESQISDLANHLNNNPVGSLSVSGTTLTYKNLSGNTLGTVTLPSGGGSYTLPVATTTTLGGVIVTKHNDTTPSIAAASTVAGRYYGVENDAYGRLFVNVPWVSGNGGGGITEETDPIFTSSVAYGITQAMITSWNDKLSSVPQATSSAFGGFKTGYTVSGKTYPVQLDSNGRAYVSVPWEALSSDDIATAVTEYLDNNGVTVASVKWNNVIDKPTIPTVGSGVLKLQFSAGSATDTIQGPMTIAGDSTNDNSNFNANSSSDVTYTIPTTGTVNSSSGHSALPTAKAVYNFVSSNYALKSAIPTIPTVGDGSFTFKFGDTTIGNDFAANITSNKTYVLDRLNSFDGDLFTTTSANRQKTAVSADVFANNFDYGEDLPKSENAQTYKFPSTKAVAKAVESVGSTAGQAVAGFNNLLHSVWGNNVTAVPAYTDSIDARVSSLEETGVAAEKITEGIENYFKIHPISVSGVKGNSESGYRTGNVNITQAHIIGSTAIGSKTQPVYWDGDKFVKANTIPNISEDDIKNWDNKVDGDVFNAIFTGDENTTPLVVKEIKSNATDTDIPTALAVYNAVKDKLSSIPVATTSVLGGVLAMKYNTQTPSINSLTTTAGRYYGVETDAYGHPFVNVPWTDTDTDTKYSAGNGLSLDGTTFSVKVRHPYSTGDISLTPSNVASRYYEVQTDKSGYLFTNVPWTDTKNTAGATNNTAKLFLIGATEQTANPQTYTRNNTYIDSNGDLYINGKKVIVSGSIDVDDVSNLQGTLDDLDQGVKDVDELATRALKAITGTNTGTYTNTSSIESRLTSLEGKDGDMPNLRFTVNDTDYFTYSKNSAAPQFKLVNGTGIDMQVGSGVIQINAKASVNTSTRTISDGTNSIVVPTDQSTTVSNLEKAINDAINTANHSITLNGKTLKLSSEQGDISDAWGTINDIYAALSAAGDGKDASVSSDLAMWAACAKNSYNQGALVQLSNVVKILTGTAGVVDGAGNKLQDKVGQFSNESNSLIYMFNNLVCAIGGTDGSERTMAAAALDNDNASVYYIIDNLLRLLVGDSYDNEAWSTLNTKAMSTTFSTSLTTLVENLATACFGSVADMNEYAALVKEGTHKPLAQRLS